MNTKILKVYFILYEGANKLIVPKIKKKKLIILNNFEYFFKIVLIKFTPVLITGGFGVVYEAIESVSQKSFAIKVSSII